MSASIMERKELDSFLESQISRIERYKSDENFTVVFIQAEKKLLETIKPTVDINLRKSDVIFDGGNHLFITLANTDKAGALHIDEMLKEFINHDLVYAFATLPEDGEDLENLYSSLANICQDEYDLDLYEYL